MIFAKRQEATRRDVIIKEIDSLYGAFASYIEDNKSLRGLPLEDNVKIPMKLGEGYTKCISHKPEKAVAHSWFSEGSIAPRHCHKLETETIFVIKGTIRVKFFPEKGRFYYKTLGTGEVIRIEPGVDHIFYFLTRTEIIAVTMPADPTFPK